jgi:hypothetical protein
MSRSVLSVEDRRADEGTSAQYTATITDESETARGEGDYSQILQRSLSPCTTIQQEPSSTVVLTKM